MMPFKRPTLQDIDAQIQRDMDTRIQGAEGRLRRAVLTVLGRVYAGATHGLHGFQSHMAKQLFVQSAEDEFLLQHASLYNITRAPAAAAWGHVTLTGDTGSVIPTGTALQTDDGTQYTTTGSVTIAPSGTVDAPVAAVKRGSGGNLTAGTQLLLLSPIAGVKSRAVAAADGINNGADDEDLEVLRARVRARIAQPPHGGAGFDYVTWMMDSKSHGLNVTRAWVYPREMGIGTITCRFMMDDDRPDGLPTSKDTATMASFLDTVRPLTATEVFVPAPIAQPVTFTIAGFVTDHGADNKPAQAAVTAELKDLIRRSAVPGGGLLLSHMREAISIASGEYDHRLISPAADVTTTTGYIITFGGITWSTK